MKGTDIALLAGVGIVGYGLLNSNFFKGLGGVGTGAGAAVEGLGSGIGFAGQAAGYNLADIFNAVGQLGQSSQLIIREGGLQTREIIRETGELSSSVIHELGEDVPQIVDYLGDIPTDFAAMGADTSGSLRSVNKGFWDAFDTTWNLNNPNNIFTNTAAGIGSAFTWVKKQVSPTPKSLQVDSSSSIITGAAVSSPTSSTSSSGGSIRASSSTSFLDQTNANITQQHTEFIDSLKSDNETLTISLPTPTPKPWWQFW